MAEWVYKEIANDLSRRWSTWGRSRCPRSAFISGTVVHVRFHFRSHSGPYSIELDPTPSACASVVSSAADFVRWKNVSQVFRNVCKGRQTDGRYQSPSELAVQHTDGYAEKGHQNRKEALFPVDIDEQRMNHSKSASSILRVPQKIKLEQENAFAYSSYFVGA